MGGTNLKTFFLSSEYIALALIRSKNQFFYESFITISELYQFEHFLQQAFNDRGLNIVITSNSLSSSGFNMIGEIIMKSNTCGFDLNSLPLDILVVLYDSILIADFWLQFEQEKLEALEKIRDDASSLCRKTPKNNY